KQDLAPLDREPLYRHYLRYYAPNNASLILVGGFDPAVAMQQVREAFGPMKPETPPDPLRLSEPEQHGERRSDLERPGPADLLSAGWHIPAASHDDIPALVLLTTVLGGWRGTVPFAAGDWQPRSNRLYRALVDTRLATDVGVRQEMKLDPALLIASVTLARGASLDRVEAVLDREVEKLQRAPPPKGERARGGRGGGLRRRRGRVHVPAPVERHAAEERRETRGSPRGDRRDARVPQRRGAPLVPGAVHARDRRGDGPHPRRMPVRPVVPAEGDRARPRGIAERRPHRGRRHPRPGVPGTGPPRVPEGPPVRAGPERRRGPDPADSARGHRLVPRGARGPGGAHPRRDRRRGPRRPRRRDRRPVVAPPRRRRRTARDPAPAAPSPRVRVAPDAAQDPGRHRDRRAGRPPTPGRLLRAEPRKPPLRPDWIVRPPRTEPAGRARPRVLRFLGPRFADGRRDVVDLRGRESREPRESDRVDPGGDGPPADGTLHARGDHGREGQSDGFADRVARAECRGRVRTPSHGVLRPRDGFPRAVPR